jgi:hypothetical protein
VLMPVCPPCRANPFPYTMLTQKLMATNDSEQYVAMVRGVDEIVGIMARYRQSNDCTAHVPEQS